MGETSAPRPVVLVVDDDDGVHAALQCILETDYEVISALGGEAGLRELEHRYSTIALILPGGERVRYQRTSPGTRWAGAVLEHTESPGPFYKSVLSYLGPDPGTWTLMLRDGTAYAFTYNGNLKSITDRFGNAITLTREYVTYPSGYWVPWGKIQRITGPSGWRHIDLTYDSQERIRRNGFTAPTDPPERRPNHPVATARQSETADVSCSTR